MNMKMKKRLLKVCVGIVSVIVAIPLNASIFRLIYISNTAEVTFENKTSFLVSAIGIKLCDRSQRIEQLVPGAAASAKFNVSGDCHFTVQVLFSDGKSLNSKIGYISNGMNHKYFVQIENNRLVEGKPVVEPDPDYIMKTTTLFTMYIAIVVLIYQLAITVIRRFMGSSAV